METENSCPNCGLPLETNALQGLCPECLMKAGWPTVDQAEPNAEAGGFIPPSIDDLAKLFPQLEILELIGRGGMGAVYKARQPNLDRVVALKIMATKAGSDPGFTERFTREARALARLSHPSIVAVYDFGHADDLSYFVMEYVDGANLREIEQAGQLSPLEALEIIPQICGALQFAHDAGVVHRDIKPENILLDQTGRVKIADFGLAKIMGQETTNFTLTEPNHVMGTPHYMAPEQVEHPRDVDHRADIYSLGVVFYEMLTGELPLGKFAPPSRKVQMDVRLDEVVLRTLEKEPELRYQQVSQVRTEVQTIVATPQVDNEAGHHLAKTSLCYISTPDYLRTFRGRFFNIYQGKGELSLSSELLSFESGWQAVTIPLTAIKTVARGTFPTSAKPLPLHYMAVTFEEHGVSRTLLFVPVRTEVMSPSEANKIGAQWLSDLIKAIQAQTGRTLSVGQLDVTQDTSLWEYVKLYLFMTACCTLGLSVIPIMLKRRLPNSLGEWLPGMLFAIPMFFMCLTMPRWAGWFRDRADRRQSRAGGDTDSEDTSKGFDFWKLVKRFFLLLVTGLLLLTVGMLIVSVVFPWLHRVRFVAIHEFGPVVERRFYEADPNTPDIVFWDLDRDVIMSPSFAVVMPEGKQLFQRFSDAALQNEPELRQWIQDCGIDLALGFAGKDPNSWSWYITGLGAERLNARFEEHSFDRFKPRDLFEWETCALRIAGSRIQSGRQSALCIKTDQGRAGVLEYDGLFDGATDGFKIRCKLLKRREKGEKAPGQPALVPVSDSNHPEILYDPNSLQGQTRGYLPTQEIWLQAGPELKDCFVDLDSGRVLSAPTELVDSLRHTGQLNEGRVQIDIIQDWLRKNSVDLFWRRSRSGISLVDGVSILVEPTHKRRVWATESADNAVMFSEHISNVLAQGMSQSNVTQMQLIQVGGTNIIRTRSGRAGLIQIRELDMQSGRIRIRYKLVSEGHTKNDQTVQSRTSQLAFRIVPKNAENHEPFLDYEERELRNALQQLGPTQRIIGTDYLWVPWQGATPPEASVTELYQGQAYVLASNLEGAIMLPDGSWGMEKTGVITNPQHAPIISVRFDGPGSDHFHALTSGNLGRSLGIIVDGNMVSAPTIGSVIAQQMIIDGHYTRAEADAMATALRAGMPQISLVSTWDVAEDEISSEQARPRPPIDTSNMPAEAQKVYQVLKDWYGAGTLGNSEERVKYLTPDQTIETSLRWIEQLNKILPNRSDKAPVPRAIHWDGREALFISDKLQLPKDQSDEPMVLLCLLTKKESKTWRIEDFDLEGVTELQLEISRFTQNHPGAQVWVGERHEPHAKNDVPATTAIDFNDASFWQTQIARHLEGVRTLDCELMTNRLVYGADANTSDFQVRRQYRLKWDRDHKWIDCAVTGLERDLRGNRLIQGDQFGWSLHGSDWTRYRAGSGGMAMSQFAHFGRMRSHPYEHAFGVAKGILSSDTIQGTQAQGVIDWSQIKLAHSLDDQGRHVLKHSLVVPGPDDEMMTADLVVIGTWEQEAFKLLELRGQCQEFDMDVPAEAYSEHIFVDGLWMPQSAEMYEWTDPAQGTRQRLREKTTVTVQRMLVNRPMTAEMFDGFEPPVGVRVDDQITGTHYRVWPDLEQIKASGGKDRVSVSGRVYLDGKPSVGVTVSTHVYDDPNESLAHTVNATSDDKGEFVLSGLVPGLEYMIQTKDQAGHNVSQPAQLSELGEDYIGLELDMTSGLTVIGTVTDSNGHPLAKARVKFSGKSVVETDEQGRYTVHGLYADKGYQVEAVAWGYAPLDPDGEASRGNFKMALGDDGEPESFDIVLQKEEILSGRVVDQDGKPVSGVRVMVWGSPFGIGDLWQWYDTRSDLDGKFSVGNLGDRIYGFFLGQYGNAYHSPSESPLLFQVTTDSFMPMRRSGRSLVPRDIVTRVEAFEQPYRQFFRLKEYNDASRKNNGGELISQWLEQLNTSDRAKQCELLARLGSVPAYHAHDHLEEILCGRTVQSSGGAVTSFGSNMASQYDPGALPADLVNCKDPNVVMLTLRALGRTGFTVEHAHLLIDKLDDENQSVRQYAVLALAELTGVYLGPDKAPWVTWLNHSQVYRSELNGKGYFKLFASLCDVFRKHRPSSETTERIMAAWQGGSKGGVRFRQMISSKEAEALTHFFASIKIDGEHPVTYGHCPGYWPTDMFNDRGHRNQNLKIQFDRTCRLGDKEFGPGRDYTLPALFRDGYHGQWEIVDLRLDDIQEIESSK